MGEERREVGGYHLLRRLGAGGMGTVHEAVDAEGRHVALKLLHPHIGTDPAARRRLEREVSLLHRVRETGVARVLDAEVEESDAFIVTELIEGPTLEEDVAADGPFAPDELATLAHGLVDALRGIHAAGVVHRDFKPGNVMMSDHGPVVIDFGIAQVADDVRLTQTGMVTGTPGYLDPEVIAGAEPGPACDWWGWAAVLVFAATGRPPFGRGPTAAVLARVATGTVDVGGLPPALGRALAGALAPSPPDRLGPDVVLEMLDAVAQGREAALDAGAVTRVLGAATATQALGTRAPGVEDPARALGTGLAGFGADATATLTASGVGAHSVGDDATRALPYGSASTESPPTRALPVLPAAYAPGPAGPPWGTPDAYSPVDPASGRAGYPASDPGGYQGYAGPVDGRQGYGPSAGLDQPFAPHEPERAPAWASPAPRRTLVVATVGLGVSALAAAVPGVFVLVAATLLVLTATAGWAGRARRASRLRRGTRPGDDARMIAGLPWHLARGVIGVVPGVLVGASLGVATWWFATASELAGPSAVLWMAGLAALAAAWLTPTSRAAREGARAVVDVLTPTRGFRALLVGLVLAVVLVVGAQVVLGAPPSPTWAPLPELTPLVP